MLLSTPERASALWPHQRRGHSTLMALFAHLRRCLMAGLLCIVAVLPWMLPSLVHAQGVDLQSFGLARQDSVLTLDFAVSITLPKPVDDALQRGVPLYFVAQADLYRGRWYWRDERVAHVARSWRLAYQPLTNTWRVGLGGLNQSHATLAEALGAVSRSSRWRLAELAQIDSDKSYYVEFSYRLDTTQLPSPMQIGVGGAAGWAVGVERVQRLE